MESNNSISKIRIWTSYILQGLVVVMFLMGVFNNLMHTEMAVKGSVSMGFAESDITILGIIMLISTILFVIPQTNILGAILLTAWLGGAVAAHFIHHDDIGHKLFPVIFGVVIWASLWLRNQKLRHIFPIA